MSEFTTTLTKAQAEALTTFVWDNAARISESPDPDELRGAYTVLVVDAWKAQEAQEVEPQPEKTVDALGAVRYMLNGNFHRVDGPAYINGDRQEWWLNGRLHRTDGPAIIVGDHQVWYLNGLCHRVDGPAYVNGDRQEWWLNGKRLTEAKHAERVAAMTVDEVIA